MNNYQLSTINYQLLNIPLLDSDRAIAKQFAAEQATPEKGLQVYLNTLSVWAVHRYLSWLQIETDITQSDCWNAGLRAMFNVADLVLADGRKIECRSIQAPVDKIIIPLEVRRDRIGVMGIQFGESLDEVQLLGFFPANFELPSEIDLRDFQDLDVFLEALENSSPVTQLVCLREWLENIFTEGWDDITNIISPKTPAFAFRQGTIQRAKVIDLEIPLILSISLKPEREEKLKIGLQLHPFEDNEVLPQNLKLMVFTAEGKLFREIIVRDGDSFIQYEFRGNFSEKFSLKVIFRDIELKESFLI